MKVVTRKSVEAGIIDTVTNWFNKLTGIIEKTFETIDGWDVSDNSTDGEWIEITHSDGSKIHIDIISNEDGTINLNGKHSNGNTATATNIEQSKDAIEQAINNMVIKMEQVAANTLTVTLQKVSAGSDIDIHLTAITANYDPILAIDTLNAIIADNDVIEMINEEPTTLAIIDTDEPGIVDVQVAEDLVVEDILCVAIETMLAAAVTFANNMLMLHWNLKGQGFSTLHEPVSQWYHHVIWDIDILGELCVELCKSAPNPGIIIQQSQLIPSGTEFTEEEGLRVAQAQINQYHSVLNTWYVNFGSDVQATLDNMMRFWAKESAYKLARQIKQ